jgi:nucleotide-binding universal stress UspA family protein
MKILIATDGSRFSEAAVEKACDVVGGNERTTFRVISVYELAVPLANEPYALSAEYYQQLDDVAKQQAEDAARNCVELIGKRVSKAQTTAIVEFGRPAQVIVEEAERWGADVVVVGSHGYGFWGRLALGSVSDAVLHHAPCSVLVVKSRIEDGHE